MSKVDCVVLGIEVELHHQKPPLRPIGEIYSKLEGDYDANGV